MNKPEDAEKLVAAHGPEAEKFMKTLIAAVDQAEGGLAGIALAATKVLDANFDLMVEIERNTDTEAGRQWQADHAELVQQFRATMAKVEDCSAIDRVLRDLLVDLRNQ